MAKRRGAKRSPVVGDPGDPHGMAAALGQQIDFVAGCFSRDRENTRETGRQLYLDPARCYATYEEMAAQEAARGGGRVGQSGGLLTARGGCGKARPAVDSGP